MKISREAKIGVAGVIALVLLFFTIKFLQGVSLFSSSDVYVINFRNAKALAKSSPVYADGFQVGIVSDIRYDYEHPGHGVIVEISVDKGMRIPIDTKAVLDEAMLGGCTLNLMMGSSPVERYEVGDTIPSADNNGLMARAAELMPQLEQTLGKVDTLLVSLNALASDPNLTATLTNVNSLTANLDRSSEQLDLLLRRDVPALTNTFNTTGQHATALMDTLAALDLQATLATLDMTLREVQAAVAQLNRTDNNAGLLLHDAAIYENLTRTTEAAAALLEDLKANPKRYVHFSLFGKKQK